MNESNKRTLGAFALIGLGVLLLLGLDKLSGTGGLLLFQAVTGYWESWAFAWTLYGVFFGLGLMIMGERMEIRDLRVIGRWMAIVSAVAFAGLGTMFMLATSSLIRLLFIVACFVVGLKLLCKDKPYSLRANGNGAKHKRSDVAVEENIERMKVRLGKDDII